jgi:hypothetical protein
MTYDFKSGHGRGRILVRGQEVLILDGAPDALFDKAWAETVKTRFEIHAKDKGDGAKDPFEGYDVVDRRRGLGLKLPKGWTATKGGRGPAAVATASKGGITVKFLVIGQGFSEAALPQLGRGLMGPGFRPRMCRPAVVMGGKGLRHPINAPRGRTSDMYMGADAARSYAMVVEGPTAELRAAADELRALLKGMPGPIVDPKAEGEPELEGALPPAGLRSIPGY